MINFFKKPYRWAIVFTVLMTGAFTFVMLDTFVIPKAYQSIVEQGEKQEEAVTGSGEEQTLEEQSVNEIQSAEEGKESTAEAEATSDQEADTSPVLTDTSYEDANIKISIDTIREYDSNIYVADIQVSDISYLKTAFANDTYGRNIKATTSDTATRNDAIFAINGDYYGFRDYGYVLRNGTLYRDTAGDAQDLVIDNSGNFSIMNEDEVRAQELDLDSIWQIFSFGPALIKDNEIAVDSTSEVSRARTSNPRTAIGQISPLHYVIVVSDGRTKESEGLSLLQLAEVFADLGCTTAYNLDGGGSSTMYFNGSIVNVPTDGRKDGEREVSDIVYVGY